MANVKITDFIEQSTLDTGDFFHVKKEGLPDRKVSKGNLIQQVLDPLAAPDSTVLVAGVEAGDLVSGVDNNTQAINTIINRNSKGNRVPIEKSTFNSWGAKGPINVLGDSISHGAFAIDNFYNSYINLLGRMFNAQYGGNGYNGFVNLANLGAGATLSRDIHGINFFGTWSFNNQETTNGQASYFGGSWQTTTNTDSISAVVPTITSRVIIWYLQQPGGGELTIRQNGISPVVINTSGVLSVKFQYLNVVDAGYGTFTISTTKTDATTSPVDILGLGYVNNENTESTIHNWSNSGRRLRYVSENTISALTTNATALILSLGVNDYTDVDADTDGTYALEFIQRINWIIQYCNSNSTPLIVNDFCWSAGVDSFTRSELKRAAKETNGLYVPLPDLIKPDGTTADSTYLVSTSGLFTDAVHPNIQGHKWIAETIAEWIGLSVSSKRQAIGNFDYWIPMDIPTGGDVKNEFTGALLVSAYKLNGNEIIFKIAVKYSVSAGAFPVGTYPLQTLFRKFNNAAIPFTPIGSTMRKSADIRNDTGASTGLIQTQLDGAVSLIIFDAAWLNMQRSDARLSINITC